jgi:signal transduction histidine kinase
LYRSGEPGSASFPQDGAVARLEDAARLCGRLGHDFDNVLMGVLGFAELAQMQLDPGSRPAKYLTELLKVADTARTITAQLHAFNRSGEMDPTPTRLADVCTSADFDSLAKESAKVRIESVLPTDLPPVAIGAGTLQSIVGHLVRNAVESMPDGGRVTLTARTLSLTDGLCEALPAGLDPGEYVELTVADSGPGFATGLTDRVGREPFVTTKVRRRGLGLPTVLRALDAHGGGLRIESSNRGTAAVVYLPSAAVVSPGAVRLVAGALPMEVSPP